MKEKLKNIEKVKEDRNINIEVTQEKFKSQNAITLVSLVVTIVILIILATVSINVLLGEGGLINQAKTAKFETEKASAREQIELVLVQAQMDKALNNEYNENEYLDKFVEDRLKGVWLEQDEISYDGFIFALDRSVPKIGNYTGQDEGPRIKEIKVTGKTTNSVSIEVDARNAEGGKYTYSYKKDSEGEEAWVEVAKEVEENTCTFENLEENEIYNLKVRIETTEGEIEQTINEMTGELPRGTITFDEVEWVGDGTAKVRVNTSAQGYTMQYIIVKQGESIEGLPQKDWSEIASGSEIEGLYYADTVYARLYDGKNESDYASVTVEDKIKPVITVNPNGAATSNSISVSVQAQDNESGIKETPTYTYYIKKTSEGEGSYQVPVGATSITSNTYTFTELTQGTSYDIKVEVNGDKAGNVGTGILENQTTSTVPGGEGGLVQGNIIASAPTWSNGEATITLSTSTGLTIQYQINGTSEGNWTTGTSVTGLHHGDAVFARLTDGTNHGDYASVNILDGIAPSITNMTTSNITTNSVTVTVTASDGQSGLATSGTYKYYLNNESTPRGTNTTGSYTFTGLTDGIQYTIKVVVADKAGNEVTETRTVSTIERQDVLPVTPSISDGMTPVKWNGSNWIKCSTEFKDWYDYEKKEWANVVLGDATFNGNTLDESQPYSMLVWIPRYAYQITTNYHTNAAEAGNINIIFIDTNNKNKTRTTTYSENYPSVSESSMSNYVVHPAFNYGGTKLSGFWVGKYETSHTGCTTDASTGTSNTNVTTKTPMIKAGVTSWRSIQVSNIYTVCTNMNKSGNPYGLNTSDSVVDPHMMKNSEWGAVAYLSQNATYGKGSEVWINNSSDYITGNAGNSVDAGSASGVTNAYKTTNGQKASTTGNVTGVYDMSGGATEYVAAYVNNGDSRLQSSGSTLVSAADKYKDVYNAASSDDTDVTEEQQKNYSYAQPTTGLGQPTSTSGHYGDAIWETSNDYNYMSTNSWYSDGSDMPGANTPFFTRGGYYRGTGVGVFSFDSVGNTRYNGFRVVLPVF